MEQSARKESRETWFKPGMAEWCGPSNWEAEAGVWSSVLCESNDSLGYMKAHLKNKARKLVHLLSVYQRQEMKLVDSLDFQIPYWTNLYFIDGYMDAGGIRI